MKKLIAILLVFALMPILPMAAFADTNASEGVYDGEYDANGKRSGYGTWAYHNFLYVGFWENDLPYGEGTLYHEIEPRPSAGGPGGEFAGGELYRTSVKGQWRDGYADGEVSFVNYYRLPNGESGVQTTITVRFGYPVSDMSFPECDFDFQRSELVAGVPPMVDVVTDSSLPAPEFVYDDSWTYVDERARASEKPAYEGQIDDGTGVYEGEYDANGKRSGYGTWAYHNYLYAGNWANDLPNGEGTLYVSDGSFTYYCYKMMLHGNWEDGFANGPIEWTQFGEEEDGPLIYIIHDVEDGLTKNEQFAFAINSRRFDLFRSDDVVGSVPPFKFVRSFGIIGTNDTPWDLYEKYPTGHVPYTPMEKIENTGISVTPGNLANSSYGDDMALLGDWIFIANEEPTQKHWIRTIYKMRADGSQMMKLYEGNSDDPEPLSPKFKLIGDWLFVNDPYIMKADDMGFTELEGDYVWGLVVDDWEYQVYVTYSESTFSVSKTKLDYSERIEMGSFAIDRRILKATMQGPEIVYVSGDWVYVYISNDGDYYSIPESDVVSQIIKVKNDGSGQVETYSFRKGIVNPYQLNGMPQFINDRVYYLESYCVDANGIHTQNGFIDRVESSLYSVNIDFTEDPVTLIPRNENQHITSFHVTEDSIYYGVVAKGTGRGAIMRADLDGGNPTVLADGFETGHAKMMSGLEDTGNLEHMLIAGEWMMFAVENGGTRTWYLMRLDGSGLHELGEYYIPSDAPGITDSTGKWRYEVLSDGGAAILGPGAKLKQSGKLSIPGTVDKIPVTAIGENAFYGCDGFTSMTIPKGVTSIGDFAFFWCKGLTGVTIPEGVTHIGDGAFQWCAKIKKVTLPASLTSIGSQPFSNCPSVKLSVAKKNEIFEIVDGALFDRVQNKYVD